MEKFYVVETVRERDCDRRSPLVSLVLDKRYRNVTTHKIWELEALATDGQIFVKSRFGVEARVRIFFSETFGRWIATTNRDNTVCDNLLFLPVSRPTRVEGGFIYFETCPV